MPLVSAVDNLTEAVEELKAETHRKTFTTRVAVGLTLAVAVFACVVGIFGIKATNDADTERQRRSVASCLQYNEQAEREIDAQRSSFHALVEALVAGSDDPQVRRDADEFNATQDALIAAKHPLRDCTPEGIERYLSKQRSS